MPLLRINTTDLGLSLHESAQPVTARLRNYARCAGPAIVMVHGYKYAPGTKAHCPHRKILNETPDQWPARLGFGTGCSQEGLGIAFGWYARGRLKDVHARAVSLSASLAELVAALRAQAPDRPVHILAHSLGAEIALGALACLKGRAVDRMILLTGASYAGYAARMLRTDAGRKCDLLNVTSRENDLFDAAFERLTRPCDPKDRTLGQGIDVPNALTLQLDCERTLEALSEIGLQIASSSRRICHWSAYTRPGVMSLYAAFLRDPKKLNLGVLSQILPQRLAPRWSRLLPATVTSMRSPELTLPLATGNLGLQQQEFLTASKGRNHHEPAH